MLHALKVVAIWLAMCGAAVASNCDFTQQFPNHPGAGPIYSGESMAPTVAPGIAPIIQFSCFFENRAPVVSIQIRALKRDGSESEYFTADTTINRDYYTNYTQIKVTFQRLRRLWRPERGLRITYIVQFGAQPVAQVRTQEPTITVEYAQYATETNPSAPGTICNFTDQLAAEANGKRVLDVGRVHPEDSFRRFCGHPASGVRKMATVVYTCNWTASGLRGNGLADFLLTPIKRVESVWDGSNLTLSCLGVEPLPVWSSRMRVIRTDYRPIGAPDSQSCNVTAVNGVTDFDRFSRAVCDGRQGCRFIVDAQLCGDPANGAVKTATVTYQCVHAWHILAEPRPDDVGNHTRTASDGQALDLRCD